MSHTLTRRLPVGAEVQPDRAGHFRVWAPQPRTITLVVQRAGRDATEASLEAEGSGYRSVLLPDVRPGDRYWYRVDGHLLPDPASRFQPDGPFAASMLVDPTRFTWTDEAWTGPRLEGQVLYEMHVGTFTQEGTWRAAIARLPHLVRSGVTTVEVMPIAEFPGRFGWGYDGVFPYAPSRLYGTPDDFRAFVDAAHSFDLSVILDVVYNHLGPDGCVFAQYSKDYFAKKVETEWGDALNFDGPQSEPVREYFVSNAGYWIAEYHLDGLRLDATQSIHDRSIEHVVAAIARTARAAANGRRVLLFAENEPQDVRLVKPHEAGGYGLDALWNDDFHHSAIVTLTGRREAYYSDHRGVPQEFISATKYGYLFQGQRYGWQKQDRGTRTPGLRPAVFVNFIENHDQLANSGDGSRVRLRTTPGRYRAMTTLLLLMPGTPMLFQGQEFGATAPFHYFADHNPELAKAVQKGRAEFIAQFPSLASPELQERLPPPHALETFERCKLDWNEYDTHVTQRRLCEDLLALRRSEVAFHAQAPGAVDGAVLAAETFVLRFTTPHEQDERLLVVNFGPDLVADSFAEPLVAPPERSRWVVQWSSERPDYGGGGTPPVVTEQGWRIPGHSAIVLRPETDHGGDGANRH
jgi:maltooligosyltrehalose trehalohydrolase